MNYAVSHIYIYPIKSLGGIQLSKTEVEPEGLKYDRRWMLVDDEGCFLSQRSLPQLCLFDVSMENQTVFITHRNFPNSEISFPIHDFSEEKIQVKIWDDEVEANLVDATIDKWFSDILKTNCRLVRHSSSTKRKVDNQFALKGEETGFSDGFPVLIIGEKSLDDLNDKLQNKIQMNRFRPNIVFSGGNAFDEDKFGEIEIGSSKMKVVKPCSRCVMTTIDQHTSSRGNEPLQTLSTYRNTDNKIHFGQNVLVVSVGEIKVGDEIRI
ncbi:MAG: MOSC N-terminal beta barrel domain-containing protein [Bacteroidota bacterium]